jgi:hypothetical protein
MCINPLINAKNDENDSFLREDNIYFFSSYNRLSEGLTIVTWFKITLNANKCVIKMDVNKINLYNFKYIQECNEGKRWSKQHPSQWIKIAI